MNVQRGTPVTVLSDGAFLGWIGTAEGRPSRETGTVLVALPWSPGTPVLAFGSSELQVDCLTCRNTAPGAFAPSHNASPRCESGGYSHCSCDTCF